MRQAGDPVPEPNVHLQVIGYEGIDYPVYFDRVPCVGEEIIITDSRGRAVIKEVIWDYSEGFAFPPIPRVTAFLR